MFTPKSRPTSSVGFTGHRKNSASVSGILSSKASVSQNRLFTAQSHRSTASVQREKPDLTINPFAEPSTPSTRITSAKSRPVSRTFRMNEFFQLDFPTSSRGQKDAKGQLLFKISEGKRQSIVKGAKSQRSSMEFKDMEIKTESLVDYESFRSSPFQARTQRSSPRTTTYLRPSKVMAELQQKQQEKAKEREKEKVTFIDVVHETMKQRKKEKVIEERRQEMLHIQEKRDIVTKPIRHSDVELRLKNQEDLDAIEMYEEEILGTYKNYKDLKEIVSTKVLKKINYLKLLRVKLREEKQEFILTMIKGRHNVRKCLEEKDFQMVVEELKKIVKVIIKMDDVNLLMEILHLLSETYLDFGQLDNAVFALNQLRMGAELTDNIPKKIEAYMGLAEACKRLKYFDIALQMLNRALNFTWNILDRETELKIYDQIGLIYFTTRDMDKASYYHNRASQGRTESETSPLFIMANENIEAYRLKNHLGLQHIAPVFFNKLTIPALRKKSVINTKVGRQRLRTLLAHPASTEEQIFEDEVTIQNASAFLEKVMSRVYYKKGVTQTESPTLFNAVNIGIEAIHQLEVMLAESDFTKEIPSPRTFDIKEKLIPEKASKNFQAIRDVKNEGFLMGNLDKRRKVINAREYQNLKKTSGKYSLHQIARENNLTLKTPSGDLIMPIEHKDLFVTFETIKRRAKKEYTSDAIESKLFLNHLSPNRCTYGVPNVPEIKPSRYFKFFETALERVVNEKEL